MNASLIYLHLNHSPMFTPENKRDYIISEVMKFMTIANLMLLSDIAKANKTEGLLTLGLASLAKAMGLNTDAIGPLNDLLDTLNSKLAIASISIKDAENMSRGDLEELIRRSQSINNNEGAGESKSDSAKSDLSAASSLSEIFDRIKNSEINKEYDRPTDEEITNNKKQADKVKKDAFEDIFKLVQDYSKLNSDDEESNNG